MSEVVAELSSALRLSDPKPDRCASCYCGADATTRFIDFDSSLDRGAIVDAGSLAVLESIDELHLCESCVRSAAEALGFKPQLHSRQIREIKRLEAYAAYLLERAGRAEKRESELNAFITANMGEHVSPQRRKAA